MSAQALDADQLTMGAEPQSVIPDASDESKTAAPTILAALNAAKAVVDANVEELGRIDAIAGDGDHGIGMERGIHAAVAAAEDAVERGAGAGTALNLAADAWADKAGGTSGALWGHGSARRRTIRRRRGCT